jgi:hypothetical protein
MLGRLLFVSTLIVISLWVAITLVPWLWVGPVRLFKKLMLKQEIKDEWWKSIN